MMFLLKFVASLNIIIFHRILLTISFQKNEFERE